MWRERNRSPSPPAQTSPDFLIQRQEVMEGKEPASGSVYWRTFAKCRVRGVHAIANVAGTATGTAGVGGRDDESGYTVYGMGTSIGTGSITQLTLGDQNADAAAHGTVTTFLEANEGLRFTKGTDGALVATLLIEYEVLPTAVMS